MISTFALAVALMTNQGQEGQMVVGTNLPMPANSPTRLWYQPKPDPLEPSRFSPKLFGEAKIPWEFPWMVSGFGAIKGAPPLNELKFRIYSQERHETDDKAPQVARMLLRLWDFNVKYLGLDNPPLYHNGIVDVFLCFGGKAGGEQVIGEDTVGKVTYKNNCIYIYDMPSFTDPVEMAREVAHEYGHATLPPVGGYKDPEDWADGYLGEKIYLRWMRDAMARGEVGPIDAMGATKEGLDKWIATNVDPVELKAAQTEPTDAVMGDRTAVGMNSFIGLGVYIADIYPSRVFARSLLMTGEFNANNYPGAAIYAAEEPESITLKIPAQLIGKAIWIPLGTGKLTGSTILKTNKKTGWTQIQVGTTPIVITNTPP